MDSEPRREPRFAEAVRRVQEGDDEAFSELVTGFQDMAVGYAYSVLGDFQLAEDAAQEAFLDAFRHIGSLKAPLAFPAWLRRIVFKHCDRSLRRKVAPTVSLEESGDATPDLQGPSPAQVAEGNQMRDLLMASLDDLPEKHRSVLVAHYMSGQSIAELAEFFAVPATTVKKRLHDGRRRLREVVLDHLADGLRARRPSQDTSFTRGVVDILHAARHGDSERVKALLLRNPRLRSGRDLMGNTALILAVACGHREVAAILLAAGAPVDVFEATAVGDTERVAAMLDADPRLLDSFSSHGFTPLALAAHFGCVETLRLLLDRGASLDVVSRHPIGVTALHAALFGRRREAARMLIDAGAGVSAPRGGKGWPRAGWTPLHYAAAYGFEDLATRLLERGADPNARDDDGKTPLDAALDAGEHRLARRLETGTEER